MKKIFIYLIIFISIFVGTATAVVYSGYHNYIEQKDNETSQNTGNSVLSNLTSGILNAESFCGEIELVSTNKNNKINGTFSYYNTDFITAQVILNGQIENFKINSNITLEKNELYIDINNIKLVTTTTDIVETFNQLTEIINNNSKNNFEMIDISSLQSALANINFTESENGYYLNLPIPNLCDIHICTDINYKPTQILLTNLKIGDEIYTLNIKTINNLYPIKFINKLDYINIGSSLKYLSPIINTLSQGNIRLSGELIVNSTPLKLNLFLTQEQTLLGDITYENLTVYFELIDNQIKINILDNYFLLSTNELVNLLKSELNINPIEEFSITDININSLLKNINTTINLSSKNTIDNCYINYENYSLNLEIGKTLYLPERITSTHYNSASDIKNFINYYKNAISNKYSFEINACYENININGKAYIELNNKFNNINKILFDGKINDIPTTIYYLENETYVKISNNHIKIENGSWNKIISSISDLLNISEKNLSAILDVNILNIIKIKFNKQTLLIESEQLDISITSYVSNYLIDINSNKLNIKIRAYPNSSEYLYIENNLEKYKYNNFSEIGTLITALNNTIDQNHIHYSGNLSINILEHTYKNIYIDVQADIKNRYAQITLDNLPTDAVITNLNNLYFSNQKCVITIQNDTLNIKTFVTARFTKITTCVTNKTIPLSTFSINNLYDILSMKQSVIDLFNKNTSESISTNLSTDTLTLLKNKLLFNYKIDFNKFITDINTEFNYTDYITNLNTNINIGNILFINLNLNKI